MSREVLVSNMPKSKGRIVSEGPVGKEWGSEEIKTDKFVIMIIDDDNTDLHAQFDTGKTHLGAPDDKGVPTVVKEYASKYSVSEAKITEILAGKKSVAIKDITDNEV